MSSHGSLYGTNCTRVWQKSGNIQPRTFRLGSLEPHQGRLFGDPYLSCYIAELQAVKTPYGSGQRGQTIDSVPLKSHNYHVISPLKSHDYHVVSPLKSHDYHVISPLKSCDYLVFSPPAALGDECAPLPMQPVVVGHDHEWLSVSPLALPSWEKLLFEPYSQRKNVLYLVLAPNTPTVHLPTLKKYFRDLSITYKVCDG